MSDFGIYVHWPYCAAICPYCDFNVYRARGATNAPLLAAIGADLFAHAGRFGKRQATSLFFGGGTPSLLRGDEIARMIDAASRAFTLAADCEITLEANPEDSALFAEQAAEGSIASRSVRKPLMTRRSARSAAGTTHTRACARSMLRPRRTSASRSI